jgi:hypothetical protein
MRIFVWAISTNTGGPESLHQLADSCARQGMDCWLHYPDGSLEVAPHFACYSHVRMADAIPDEDDVVVVLPEVATHLVPTFHRARVVFWWLSVDNNHGQFTDFDNPHIIHACQSEYARAYLEANGVRRSFPLRDYVNDSYRLDAEPRPEKLNLIAFNPSKGYEIARHIIAALGHRYGFAPLAGLTRPQVKRLLTLSKVYIDFGHHPGRDRLPREAALMGNAVVIGAMGSAANPIDVPVPEAYRVGCAIDHARRSLEFNLDSMCAPIDALMQEYDARIGLYEPYVRQLRQEKEEVDRQVADLFGRLAAHAQPLAA